jgi:hypothetical protein
MSHQEKREISMVFEDYGDFYNGEYDRIQSGVYPGLGNLYYIKDPIHLLRIAMNLSRFAELTTVDLPQMLAFGWTTGLTTVLIKIRDLKDSFLRYQQGDRDHPVHSPILNLVEQANVIADPDFRERFCQNWPMMVREYPFIMSPGEKI